MRSAVLVVAMFVGACGGIEDDSIDSKQQAGMEKYLDEYGGSYECDPALCCPVDSEKEAKKADAWVPPGVLGPSPYSCVMDYKPMTSMNTVMGDYGKAPHLVTIYNPFGGGRDCYMIEPAQHRYHYSRSACFMTGMYRPLLNFAE